ncbi:MAG: BON domain-containing protein [Burkholderiaceae bacterium]
MHYSTPLLRGLATGSALVALTVVAGCAGGPYQAAGGSLYNRDAQRQMQNQDLEDRVRATLRSDPRVGVQGLQVKALGEGKIEISGTPANGLLGRELAMRLARSVPGVTAVFNNMTMN